MLILIGLGGLLGAAVLYPSWVAALAYMAPVQPVSRRVTQGRTPPDRPERISVIVATAGEAHCLPDRVSNLVAQGWTNLEIVLVLDGWYLPEALRGLLQTSGLPLDQIRGSGRSPWDATRPDPTRVSSDCPALVVVELPERVGKTAAQMEGARLATGDILVFTDAAARFEAGTLGAFATTLRDDPSVGTACGLLVYEDPGRGDCERTYWSYETALRRLESRAGCLIGASGAAHAMRRCDLVGLPPHALFDLVEPLALEFLGRGRAVLVEGAIAIEPHVASDRWGTSRRRIQLRALGSLPLLLPALDVGSRPRLAAALVGHKLLRWSTWVWVLLLGIGLWKWTEFDLGSIVTATVLGLALTATEWGHPVTALWSQALGTLDWMRGRRCASWPPTHLRP